MRILLDENTPVQMLPALQQVLPGHEVDHVANLQWASKKDLHLIPDAAARGYQVLVTKDGAQLDDPDELDAIKKAGIHHVRFKQGRGILGLARALGSVIATMPEVMDDLSKARRQRLVQIKGLEGGRRHEVIDPRKDPPKYWPR